MAFVSDGNEYSSPSKRIKLDQTQHLSNSNVELDFGAFSAPLKNVHEVIQGEFGKNMFNLLFNFLGQRWRIQSVSSFSRQPPLWGRGCHDSGRIAV
jgi:hypothetical protein